jgi:actin-like ATPase involved in cell morphogenesis/tetratricopeptide (TPR) repeat protein
VKQNTRRIPTDIFRLIMPTHEIAIDFGTTRTKVAHYDPGSRAPCLIELGHFVRAVIPSVFYIPATGPRLVGDEAQSMIDHDPVGVVIGLKKEIHKLGKIRCGTGRPTVGRVELAAELFAHIRKKCLQEVFHHGDLTACTLTVPVAFEDQKRRCLREAAEKGGFKQVTLVEEPVAAARAWLAQLGQQIPDHVVVCDIGGGTTDFAVLRRARGRFETVPEVPTAGFSEGGNDIDEYILARLLEDGEGDIDAIGQRRSAFLIRLREVRERFGRLQTEERVALDGVVLTVHRDTVAECSKEFIEKATKELKQFLTRCESAGGLKALPVLLIGGGSRLLGLKEAVEVLPVGQVYLWNHSDFAVVLGAAEPPRPGDEATRAASVPTAPQATPASTGDSPGAPAPNHDRWIAGVRAMIGDGHCERAFRMVHEVMQSTLDDQVFELWVDVSNSVSDRNLVLSAARELHRVRGDVWSSCCLVDVLTGLGRYTEAAELFRPFRTTENDSLFPAQFAHLNIAAAVMDNTQWVPPLHYLLELRPENATLLAMKAGTTSDPNQRSAFLERAARNGPNNLLVLMSITMCYLGNARSHEEAAVTIRLRLKNMERIAPTHYLTRVIRGLYFCAVQDFDAARQELNTVADYPEVRASNSLMAFILKVRSRIHQMQGSAIELQRDVNEWVRLAPRDSDARCWRGKLLTIEGRHADALRDFETALAATPDQVDALIGRGWCHFHLENSLASARDFELAYRHQPDNLAARFGVTCAVIEGFDTRQWKAGQPFANCYFHPQIPADKLQNIMTSYAEAHLSEQSSIALVFDNTWLGGAREGFSITENWLLAHNLLEKGTVAIRLADITSVKISGTNLLVNGQRVGCSGMTGAYKLKVLSACRDMLLELGAVHQRLNTYRRKQSSRSDRKMTMRLVPWAASGVCSRVAVIQDCLSWFNPPTAWPRSIA